MNRRMALIACFLVAASAFAADVSLPELFNRAKGEFAKGEYRQSLADFDLLDSTSQKPGFEADRAKLVPVIAFYRGANLASLGKRDEAKEAFIVHLAASPNSSIASPPFSRAVVDAFEQARKEAARRSNSINVAYAAFVPPAGWSLAADEKWTLSPVRYLLSADQKKAYAALTAPAERETFVTEFWKSFDDGFRRDFERRVAFADASFGDARQTGRESDRGLIFTFLGPPTFASLANLRADDDAMATLRGSGAGGKTIMGALTGAGVNDNLESELQRGKREVWVYRQGRIPAGIAFTEVQLAFVTKEGYGSGVLQKDPAALQILGQAVENAQKLKKLN